jgi:hypothetical protein
MVSDASVIERASRELPTELHDPLWLEILEWTWDLTLTVLPLLFLGKALFVTSQPHLTISQHWLALPALLTGGKRRNLGEQSNAWSYWDLPSFP